LIGYLQFYVLPKNLSLVWRCHHCKWRAAKFRPMLGTQGLCAGRDLYCDTPAVTRGFGFSGLTRRTALFSRLLRHTRGCEGSILTRILTGTHSFASYDTQGDVEDPFLPSYSREIKDLMKEQSVYQYASKYKETVFGIRATNNISMTHPPHIHINW
jgi:hypothetical protein